MRRCPKCRSREVSRIPPNWISNHPGFRCDDCGLKMRDTGMFLVYGLILFISLVILAVNVAASFEIGFPAYKGLILGGVGAVFCTFQLFRPVPLED